jgi:hypothetical protein
MESNSVAVFDGLFKSFEANVERVNRSGYGYAKSAEVVLGLMQMEVDMNRAVVLQGLAARISSLNEKIGDVGELGSVVGLMNCVAGCLETIAGKLPDKPF